MLLVLFCLVMLKFGSGCTETTLNCRITAGDGIHCQAVRTDSLFYSAPLVLGYLLLTGLVT